MISRVDTSKVKKAYFQEYGDGERVLKIWTLFNQPEIIKLDTPESLEWSINRNRHLEAEIRFCLSFGFEHDTYPIDNRTENDLIKEYEDDRIRCYQLGLGHTVKSYEEWKAAITPTF